MSNFLLLGIILAFPGPLVAQRKINFSGLEWVVRSGTGGPGPNHFLDATENVWTDTSGYLHLKIRNSNGTWSCSEVYLQKSYGYGEYWVEIQSDVEQYDPNVVVGFFTYESDTKEIDIEFSRWGQGNNPPGWYTVQPPPYTSQNQDSFEMGLSGLPSTHFIRWEADSIQFRSYRPYLLIVPPNDSLINRFTYRGQHIPPVGNERLHINFWLYHGNPPANQQEAELIIRSVHVPSPSSVENKSMPEALHLYPVPTTGILTLDLGPGSNPRTILFHDELGRLQKQLISSEPRINVSLKDWSPGLYSITVLDGEKMKRGYTIKVNP